MLDLQPRTPETAVSTYVLTMDLGEKLESFRHIGLQTPGPRDDYIFDIQTELQSALQDAMPEDTEVKPVYMSDLADSVISQANAVAKEFNDPVIVSTCPEIADPVDGVDLEINRIIDSQGRAIGIGPRPGHPAIETQISRNFGQLAGRDIIIVEDGIFSGSTMRHVAKKLGERRLDVAAMVAGFSCTQSSLGWLNHTDYDLHTALSLEKVLDWIPDHDFLPFVPGSGKLLGAEFNGKAYPFYDSQKVSYATPYIRPFGKTDEWASIPYDSTEAFSMRCIELARTIFRDLEKQNPGTDITIGKITQTRRRTSVPLALKSDGFPSLRTKVTDYLNELD